MITFAGHYDFKLVTLSVLIAVLAAGAALDLASRVTAARGWFRSLWLAGGAFAMGLGIWSMHYTGMLAFDLPVPVTYELPTVGLSLLAAIAASGVALLIASQDRLGWQRVAWGSLVMGAGIAGMHYIGIAAMRMSATIVWRPVVIALSIGIAVAVAGVALLFAFQYGRPTASAWRWRKVGTAMLMGAAIPAMHYTGMAAARFQSSVPPPSAGAVDISVLGAYAIGAGTLIVLAMAIGTALVSRYGEDQLRSSEARYRALADRLADAQAIAHVGSWEWDVPANIVTWSHELRRIFGIGTDAPAGYQEFLAIAHPDDRARLDGLVADSLRTQHPIDFEWRVVRPDGSIRELQSRNVVISGDDGRPVGMAGTCLDITDRKRTEQALVDSERYHRALIDQSLDLTTLVDADGFVRYASPSNEAVLGYPPGELVGRRVFELVHPDDLGKTLSVFSDGSSTPGAVRRLEFRLRHRNGSWRVLSAVGRNLFDDPVIRAGIINARDVTEQKAAEEHERTLLRELQQAVSEVKVLKGILPICASCKRIKDGNGKWEAVESYVRERTNAEFSHGVCPDCAARDWGAASSRQGA